ncbi:PAS domain S-box protein [Methanospirillum sp.]|uniref:PAS domain S-box protein n=1 Tax=Methanospirillum sp. TaxID=45200 RepID=UPI0035A12A7E
MKMSAEKITVLAVDDEEEILGIISQYLSEDENFVVIGASSVGEALEIMTHHDISAIVSDYLMPGTNGIEFLSLLREQGNSVPFILFTGKGCEEVVIQSLNLGADFYIVKGEDPALQFQMLKMQILSLIEKKKSAEALVISLKENRQMLSQLRATLEATEEGILVTDQNGFIRNFNEQFLHLWDLSSDAIQNIHIDSLLKHFSHVISDPLIITEMTKTGDEPRSQKKHTFHRPDGKILEIFIHSQRCDGQIIGTVFSFRDITTRIKAEIQLQESRERFRILFDQSPVSHMAISPDGKITDVNQAWLALMKKTRETVINLPFDKIIADKSKLRFFACLKEILNSNHKHSLELVLINGDGELITVLVDGSTIRKNNGTISHIQCILRDITYQRKTEKRLLWAESLLNEIVNMLPFGICVTRNRNLEIFYHNRHFLDVWGDEIITDLPKTGRTASLQDFFSVSEGFFEHPLHSWNPDVCKNPDISCRDIELPKKHVIREFSRRLSDGNGEERILWAFEDITRFKNQEEEIRRYTRKIEILSRLISLSGRAGSVTHLCELSLSALISVLHFDGGIFYLLSDERKKAVMTAKSGLSQDIILEMAEINPDDYAFLYSEGKPLFTNNLSYIMPEFAKKWEISGSAFIPVLSGEKIIGSIHLISNRPVPISIEEQQILLGIGNEIGNGLQRLTDQKQLEEERKNLENLVQSIKDLAFVIDEATTTILAINEEVIIKTGLCKENLIGRTISESKTPYLTYLPLKKAVNELQPVKYVIPQADGSKIIMETQITSGTWNGKKAYFCMCRDISSMMLAQEEIRQSEERLNAIFLTCPIGIILFDPDDTIIQINPAALNMFGIMDPLDLARYSYMDDPNISDLTKKKIQNREIFTTKMSYDVSKIRSSQYYQQAGPNLIHIKVMMVPVTFSVPRMNEGYYVLIEDITAQHHIESELRRLTQKLNRIMDASDDGFFFYHLPDDTISLSPRLIRMLGLSMNREVYPLQNILMFVHEDDRNVLHSFFCSLKQEMRESVSHEIRIKHPEGGWIWVYLRGKITSFDDAGNPQSFAGAITDITRRKKSEQKLLESENFNKGLISSLPEHLMIYDKSGTILFVNKNSSHARQRMNHEIIGKNILDFIVPEKRSFVRSQFEKRIKGEILEPYEIQIMRSDGSDIYAEVQATDILYKGNPAILTIMTDITERKQNEENIERYAETLKGTVEALASSNKKLNLLSNITRHDILNQIHIIMSYLALLKESPIDSKTEHFLEKIVNAVGFVQRHIEFTRNYQDIGVHTPVWQNPEDIIEKLDFEGKYVVKHLDNLEMYADPLLPKIFENLLDNSIRHGMNVTLISINYEIQPDNQLMLIWEDNGVGIEKDSKNRIFERGYGKNTGLGLFLIKEILSLSGISIHETGEIGKGAKFCLLIPEDKYRFTNS